MLLGLRGSCLTGENAQISKRRGNVFRALTASKVWFGAEPRHFPLERLFEQLLFIGCQFEQRGNSSRQMLSLINGRS